MLWAILECEWGGGTCDVNNPAAGLPMTMYHVRVVGVPCVPPSEAGGSGYTGP